MIIFNKPTRATLGALAIASSVITGGMVVTMASLPALAATPEATDPAAQPGLSADARATWESIQKFTAEQRDQALAAGQRLLTAIDRDLADLRAKIDASTGTAKEQWQQQEDSLKKARDDFSAALDGLRNDAGDSWNVVRKRLADAYYSIDDGLRSLWNKLKS